MQMKESRRFLKLLIPLLAAIYGLGVIYVTAMPLADSSWSFGSEVLTWLLTLVAIGVTYLIAAKIEPIAYPEAREFSLKPPAFSICIGLVFIAPLWVAIKEGIVYGLTSCIHSVQLEPMTYSAEELREDLIAGIHAVLLAPVLEELCYRQLAIAPFRRRWTQVIVCVVMAVLFGVLHVRNFPGAFLSAMVYGLAFILTRNIWCPILLHAGCNLTGILAAVYCTIGLGEIRMAEIPVILVGDTTFIIASVVLAVIGVILLTRKNKNNEESNPPRSRGTDDGRLRQQTRNQKH